MAIHRIFCIGRNYAEHIAELGNEPDSSCVVFMKPPSSVVRVDEPLILPRNRGAVHHEAELVVMLNGGGRDIPEQRAHDFIGAITLGLDLTLRDVQNDLKAKGAPWELAKAFDGAAVLGKWQPYRGQDLQALEFRCSVNGELRQQGRTADMIFPVSRQIHILSQTWSLQAGDVIYTGTPKGVGPLNPGDRVELASPATGSFAWTCS
jgi:2-keto-4-pentenoate hydratase/2-oxohepta-3-ene-1,7-dioic acid hydratase in catechol pathway